MKYSLSYFKTDARETMRSYLKHSTQELLPLNIIGLHLVLGFIY